MKKNKMMRLASGLLVAVLLTTSMISGTYAKYVSTASGSDSARVARWGFETTTITIDDLFVTEYDGSVLSSNTDDVIAPGTTKSQDIIFTTASGDAPEVDYKFEVEATTTATATNTILTNPNIVWAFYEKGTAAAFGTFDEMLTAIDAMTVSHVDAGNLPALSNTYVVEWKWIFDETAANKEVGTANNDLNDTSMGNANPLEEIDLTISITATQID